MNDTIYLPQNPGFDYMRFLEQFQHGQDITGEFTKFIMKKGLEESLLFGMPPETIDRVVINQSVTHDVVFGNGVQIYFRQAGLPGPIHLDVPLVSDDCALFPQIEIKVLKGHVAQIKPDCKYKH